MNFKELNLRAPDIEQHTVKIMGGTDLAVRTYLPIGAKADLITWVINMALDDTTGCISPIRLETYFAIAVVQRYANIEIDLDENWLDVYDILEQNDVINQIMSAIPEDELSFLQELVQDTAADIVRYNNSFAGIMNAMGDNMDRKDALLTDILEKVKNAEGLETLSEIKNVVGTD